MPSDFPPELLERYPFVRALGAGSFASVYLGEQPALGRTVVVKVLTHEDVEARLRFVREARLLARIDHPGVTRVVDHGTLGAANYIITVYEPGDTLRELLAPGEPLPWADAARLLAGVMHALAAVHARDILHRDLSTANVLVTDRGPVLLDFGLAVSAQITRLTEAGAILGTPRYMAPELMSGDAATAASDLFSCGVMFFEMLAGRSPHPASNLSDLMRRQMTERVTGLPPGAPPVPPQLEALVVELLSKDAAERPPSARFVATLLDAVLEADAQVHRGMRNDGALGSADRGAAQHAAPAAGVAGRAARRAAPRWAWIAAACAVALAAAWGGWRLRSPRAVAVIAAATPAPVPQAPEPDAGAVLESAARAVAPGGQVMGVDRLIEELERVPARERASQLERRAATHLLVRALSPAVPVLAARPDASSPGARMLLYGALGELAKLRLYARVRHLLEPGALNAVPAPVVRASEKLAAARRESLLPEQLQLVSPNPIYSEGPVWSASVLAPAWARTRMPALEVELHKLSDSQPYVVLAVAGGGLRQTAVVFLDPDEDVARNGFFVMALDPAIARAPRWDVSVTAAALPLKGTFARVELRHAWLVERR